MKIYVRADEAYPVMFIDDYHVKGGNTEIEVTKVFYNEYIKIEKRYIEMQQTISDLEDKVNGRIV